jgi:hypothetical protein
LLVLIVPQQIHSKKKKREEISVRRHVKKNRCAKSARRLSVKTVLIAVAILTVGSVAVASRQQWSTKPSAETDEHRVSAVQDDLLPASTFDTVTQDGHEKLAEGLGQMINQSTEGLTEIHHSDGSVSLNLEDRFQNVSVAKVTNGRLSQSCLDNPQSAGVFFSIDPKLIDNTARSEAAPVEK